MVRTPREEKPCALLLGIYISTATNGSSMEILQKIKMELPYHPAIPLQGIHLKKTKTLTWRNICILMFTAGSFKIAKIQKQPKCPLVDERINKPYINITIHTHKHTYTQREWNIIQPLKIIESTAIPPWTRPISSDLGS